MGLPGYLLGCLPVLPGWGVRCSRSYREGGHRTSLPIGPTTATKPGRAKRRTYTYEPQPSSSGFCSQTCKQRAHRSGA
jgi:hypothetical protein